MHASENDHVRAVDFIADAVRKAPQKHAAHLFEHHLIEQGIAPKDVGAGAKGTQKVAPEPLLARVILGYSPETRPQGHTKKEPMSHVLEQR
ncbi:hypothetical protein [Longimicrobium sp.]|uniref:hypothetical protein n=1 Tax=Longimicrobium sp. TaxID=2029185 RepID=UPI003B3BACBD